MSHFKGQTPRFAKMFQYRIEKQIMHRSDENGINSLCLFANEMVMETK